MTIEDVFSLAPGRKGKKADVYRVGVLALSLLQVPSIPDYRYVVWPPQGRAVSEQPPSLPGSLAPSLRDFLARCTAREERDRSAPGVNDMALSKAGGDDTVQWPRRRSASENEPVPADILTPSPPPPRCQNPSATSVAVAVAATSAGATGECCAAKFRHF